MRGKNWSVKEDAQLRGLWIVEPVSRIALVMGRPETAVIVRAKRLGLRSVEFHPRLLTVTRVAAALGVNNKTAWAMMRDGRLTDLIVTAYRRNSATPVISLLSLEDWVGEPANWWAFDPDKVQDERLQAAVAKARRWWRDEWWSVKQACAELHVCAEWVNRRLRNGLIGGRKCGPNWVLLRSDVMRVKEELHRPGGWLRFACDEANIREFGEQ